STSRISIWRSRTSVTIVSFSFLRCDPCRGDGGQCEAKRRAFACFRLHPDAPAVALDDLLADRQAHAGAAILFASVQPLEDNEDAVVVLRVNPDAVVAHREDPLAIL